MIKKWLKSIKDEYSPSNPHDPIDVMNREHILSLQPGLNHIIYFQFGNNSGKGEPFLSFIIEYPMYVYHIYHV